MKSYQALLLELALIFLTILGWMMIFIRDINPSFFAGTDSTVRLILIEVGFVLFFACLPFSIVFPLFYLNEKKRAQQLQREGARNGSRPKPLPSKLRRTVGTILVIIGFIMLIAGFVWVFIGKGAEALFGTLALWLFGMLLAVLGIRLSGQWASPAYVPDGSFP